MDVAEHIASISGEGELLARTAERIPLDTRVPTCPGWRMRDLLAHLGYVHRWAAGYVAEARTEMVPRPDEVELLRLAPGDDELIGWFREGHARLVSVLSAADPAVRCWTFLPAPSPLAFWARRQAHETAIHRVDAQLAAALVRDEEPRAFDPRFAADGIDELLMGFGRRGRRQAPDGRPGALWLRAADGDGTGDGAGPAWAVGLGAEHTEISRVQVPAGAGAADEPAGRYCEISGPGSDLYLMLWNRKPPGALSVRGDPALLEAWRGEMRIRWS
ncbi:MAG TPA: maleylpyruvate isomerase family mycothiol-dependent enzyme [Streptosporangiaceae bacterium]|jgi:uncharacterized protein (TIGR03083 family)